jgi:multidrug transporter EmrE-like cation transporter
VAPGADELRPAVRFSGEGAVARTLQYLPTGIAYALFAPFPWSTGRTLDLLTVPEMIAWYVLLAFALATLWRERRRWRELVGVSLFCAGLLAVLALAEGNYGTLFRHRAMAIPFVVMIAMPALVDGVAAARAGRLWPASRAVSSRRAASGG